MAPPEPILQDGKALLRLGRICAVASRLFASAPPLTPRLVHNISVSAALVYFCHTKTSRLSDQAHSLFPDDASDYEFRSLYYGPAFCKLRGCSDGNGDRHESCGQPNDDSVHNLFDSNIYSRVRLSPTLDCSVGALLKAWREVTGLTLSRWCMVGDEEYQVSGPTATEEFQAEYTDCHSHSSEM